MIFLFEKFAIDTALRELRVDGDVRPIQPQALALVELLLANPERMVPKDEIIEKVWDGRFISDAALNSCVRLARQALDDDGKQQRVIKTVHGSGFRFVAPVKIGKADARPVEAQNSAEPATNSPAIDHRPSIAVLPFDLLGHDEMHSAIAEAIPAELIGTLSRLRWLKVIARGSSFRFGSKGADIGTIAAQLGAGYLLTGTVELGGARISLSVELSDASDASVIWADRFSGNLDDVFGLRANVAEAVANALELRLPLHEANSLRFTPSQDLNAWGHYHLGARHMYQYSREGNVLADRHFQQALALDPQFARARAARSYTEFQNYFQMFGDDLGKHKSQALEYAQQAVELDPLDPFCTLMLGRIKWLYGEVEDGLTWVNRSVDMNPSSAYGFYNRALFNTILCEGDAAAATVDTAIALSPLDPNMQSMLGTRAMAAFVSEDVQSATKFADQAVRAPNSHLYVFMIAAAIYSQSGQTEKAQACLKQIREKDVPFGKAEFLQHYNLRNDRKKAELEDVLNKLGL